MKELSAVSRIPAPDWQQALASAYSNLGELLTDLDLEHVADRMPESILHNFPLRVPRGFVARMRRGDAQDPLLLQILPRPAEADHADGFGPDPVGDLAALKGNGLLQKYAHRALVVTTGACAVNCRYCFRRAFPYRDAALHGGGFADLGARLNADVTLTEVILSGGDPLSLTDAKLERLLQLVDGTPHVRRIRIHTRVPIVLPERVTSSLVNMLLSVSKPLVMVLHCNHANEIDATVRAAIGKLRPACRALLNQSVLLAGINDDMKALVQLSETLFSADVLPYYLHQLDPVEGSAHFAVGDDRARRLLGLVAAQLPGYLVPRLAREQIGATSKTILAPTRDSSGGL